MKEKASAPIFQSLTKMQPVNIQQGRVFILIFLLFFSLFSYTHADAFSTESRLTAAREKANQKKYKDAIEIYNSILSENPEHVESLNSKARVLSWLGQYNAARALYRESLSIDPDNIDALTGLSDTYAWQKDYTNAIQLLEQSLKKYPANRIILIRLARYNLWRGHKFDAILYSNIVLKNHPEDPDALSVKQKSESIKYYEYYAGFYYLDINNNDNSHTLYTGLKYDPGKLYSFYGQIDYMSRFNQREERLLLGGALKYNQLGIEGEIGVSSDPVIFPEISTWIELSFQAFQPAVLYGRLIFANYMEASVYGLSAAVEYYPLERLSFLSRYIFSDTEFDTGGQSTEDTILLKLTWFFNDNDKVHVYYSQGNEAYKIETIDKIGGISAHIYGAGATYFLTKSVGISPVFEYQKRAGGTRYIQTGLEMKYRF